MQEVLLPLLSFPLSSWTKKPRLLSLTLAVTYRCQSRCLTCQTWQRPFKKELLPPDYLPFFQTVKNDLVHLSLTGGEPFLSPHLYPLVDLAVRSLPHLTWISLSTNGFLTEKIQQIVPQILKIYPRRLSLEISLDGQEGLHDRIRGLKGSYCQALKTFQFLKQLSQTSPRLTVFFSYTFSRFNLGCFPRLLLDLNQEFPVSLEDFSFNLEQTGFYYQRTAPFSWKQKQINSLKKDLDFILKKSRLQLKRNLFGFGKILFQRFYLKNLPLFLKNPRHLILPCAAGSQTLFLDPYGDLYPCLVWNEKLGNIKTLNFDKLWVLRKLKIIRQKIKLGQCPICFTPCQVQISYLSQLPLSLFKTL